MRHRIIGKANNIAKSQENRQAVRSLPVLCIMGDIAGTVEGNPLRYTAGDNTSRLSPDVAEEIPRPSIQQYRMDSGVAFEIKIIKTLINDKEEPNMLNRTTLMGRLARDVEMRHTQSGTSVASFRLAVDRDFKDKDTGERGVDWIDVVAWRSTAEFVSKYLSKGRLVVVEGRLQIRDWTDRDGNKRRNAEIVADTVYFADSRPQPRQEQSAYAPVAAGATRGDGYGGDDLTTDDDLPF